MNPTVPVNYPSILVAALVSIVLGMLWYGPLFGKQWMTLSGITKEKIANDKKSGMGKSYLLMVIGTLIMAYILQHALVFASAYLKSEGLSAGLMVGFFNWLGFIAPVTLGSVLWEGKSWKLWLLNNAYHFISLSVMGAILALWQ